MKRRLEQTRKRSQRLIEKMGFVLNLQKWIRIEKELFAVVVERKYRLTSVRLWPFAKLLARLGRDKADPNLRDARPGSRTCPKPAQGFARFDR